MSVRKIIHIDMDAFYASVEQRDVPRFRNKPIVVGGQPNSRGVVAACSYEARKFGVRSAMPCSQAYRLCPDAIFVRPRFDAYREVSQQVHEIFRRFTSDVEPLSLDEAYLDVSEVDFADGSATAIAEAIRTMIFDELKLTASAGVSYNKFLAKIASDENKPNGLCVVKPEDAPAFIATLSIKKFHGVGKVTEEKMHSIGIYTGADLKKFSLSALQMHFGKVGKYYYDIARGVDNRPVKAHRQRKSLGCERTYSEDLKTEEAIQLKLTELVDKLYEMLVKRDLKAKTYTLKIKFSDFSQITRSISVAQFSNSRQTLDGCLRQLFKKLDKPLMPVRLLGVSASNFNVSMGIQKVADNDSEPFITDRESQLQLI